MNERQLKIAIQNTSCFKAYERFKQGIVLRQQNLIRLHDLYGQADRLGIDYLRQNPNIMQSDFKLVEELILNK